MGIGWAVDAVTVGTAFRFHDTHWQTWVGDESVALSEEWMAVRPIGGTTNSRCFMSNLVALKPAPGADVAALLAEEPPGARTNLSTGWWIVGTASPLRAARLAERLSTNSLVLAASPVMRRPLRLHGAYAAAPNDPYFGLSFHLENRNADGSSAGADLNVRAAWPFSRGAGVIVGGVDDGIVTTHPDLLPAASGTPHFNFVQNDLNVEPHTSVDDHGTSVAGIIAATAGNGLGVAGVAPSARLAAMRIFSGGNLPLSDLSMATMFGYRDDMISVQNHSWGYTGDNQERISGLERDAITAAANTGRAGKGVVMVRSAGNERFIVYPSAVRVIGNANNDGYLTMPESIAVAAVRRDGRVASYSSPGANVLVAAPSSDEDEGFEGIATTDRPGSDGYNVSGPGDAADYAFGATAFTGTSASAPQISGVVALLLAANPALTRRDVQHILVLSARHIDTADPLIRTNGAGLLFSFNVGFGVPDAGVAVELARQWISRPSANSFAVASNLFLPIPDDGLRVEVPGMPGVTNFSATAGLALHPDDPTLLLPLVDVGLVTGPLTTNLTGKGALIQRGISLFEEKVRYAADAGAAFAIIYNNVGGNERFEIGGTDRSRIPVVAIGQANGLALSNRLATTNLDARLAISGASVPLLVTNEMVCEHVLVTLQTDHLRRGDLRITLKSPAGSISVLQMTNTDNGPGPYDWTYMSVDHFLEPSKGVWTVTLSDQIPGNTGNLLGVTLTVVGTSIKDSDGDGLDDDWEMTRLGTLARGPKDDPDNDGFNNAREQAMGTNPQVDERALKLDLSPWNGVLWRLSWPSTGVGTNSVESSLALPSFGALTNVPSRFPVNEVFLPFTNATHQFFRLKN